MYSHYHILLPFHITIYHSYWFQSAKLAITSIRVVVVVVVVVVVAAVVVIVVVCCGGEGGGGG